MSMLIPGQNQLAEPAIIAVDEFEPLLAEFKAFVVDYVATRAPQSAARLNRQRKRTADPSGRAATAANLRRLLPLLGRPREPKLDRLCVPQRRCAQLQILEPLRPIMMIHKKRPLCRIFCARKKAKSPDKFRAFC
jgi:hypothetical protein